MRKGMPADRRSVNVGQAASQFQLQIEAELAAGLTGGCPDREQIARLDHKAALVIAVAIGVCPGEAEFGDWPDIVLGGGAEMVDRAKITESGKPQSQTFGHGHISAGGIAEFQRLMGGKVLFADQIEADIP